MEEFDSLDPDEKKQFLQYLLTKMFTNESSPDVQDRFRPIEPLPEYQEPKPQPVQSTRFKALKDKMAAAEAKKDENGDSSGRNESGLPTGS